jgi:hypothetical protein
VQRQPDDHREANQVGKRRILLDTRSVTATDGGITRRFWPAEKHPGPVLSGDRPWERFGVSIFGNVLRDQDRFRMWYMAWPDVPPSGNSSYVAYAESDDGIHWEKPALGIEPFAGDLETNLVDLVRTVPSVILEPDEADPAKRYKAGGYIGAERVARERGRHYPGDGFYVAHSPDGLRWTDDAADRPIGTPHDVGTFIRDQPRGRYLGAVKQMLRPDLTLRRSIGMVSSEDFRHWTVPKTALVADALDDRMARERGFHHAEFYGMGLQSHEDFLVGFVWIFWVDPVLYPSSRHGVGVGMWGHMDCHLVYSYDGDFWYRTPDHRPFISLGQRGDFDGCQILTASCPVPVGDELWLYYTGYAHQHGFYLHKPWQNRPDIGHESAISIARIKRDRYASLSANGEGSFTVRHGVPDGRRLLVNARAPYGVVKAQVLDADGAPIDGFGVTDCTGFSGDSVQGELSWSGGSLADLPPDRDISLLFVLEEADLFAYELG